ncbi:hypothetical protein [Spirosoma areae]
MTGEKVLGKFMVDVAKKAGLWGADQAIAFPLITKSGVNRQGKVVHYYFNYSDKINSLTYPYRAWGMKIVVEK